MLTNVTAKSIWIQEQLQKVNDYYLDGVNFDYEEAILQDQPELRDGYTDLVAKTTAAFKSYDPSLMVNAGCPVLLFSYFFLYFQGFLFFPIF